MADSFSKREKGFEAKYQLDQELAFKAESRRNKLLGLWLAEHFGLSGDDAQAYAKEVIVADMDEPGVEDVMRKVMKDVESRGAGLSEAEVRAKIAELEPIAVQQIRAEN